MLKIKISKPAKEEITKIELPQDGSVDVDTFVGTATIKDAYGNVIKTFKVKDFKFHPPVYEHGLSKPEPSTDTPMTDDPLGEYIESVKKKVALKDKRVIDSIKEGTAILSEKQSKCKFCKVGNMEWVKYKTEDKVFRWALVEQDEQGALRVHRCLESKKEMMKKMEKDNG